MNFLDLFGEVRKRRRLFLPDDRYLTVVAFITGCDAATDWSLLDGFNEWICDRFGIVSGFHWSTIIAGQREPEILKGERCVGGLSTQAEEAVIDLLFEVIEEFLFTKKVAKNP